MTGTDWQRLDGDTRGSVSALALAAPNAVFATTPVGVYRSLDAGCNWQQSGTHTSVAFGDCLAVEGGTLFVGAPDGLHQSRDNGETWQHVLVGSRVTSVVVNAGTVLAGTDTDGVLRSEDGGRSWSGANAGLLDLEVFALSISPGFDADRLAFVGTASGLYRSRNGGDSWRGVETGLNEPGIQCLAIGRDRLVVAGTEADGLVCSTDGGATWHQPADLAERSVRAVAISPCGTIAAATDVGISTSLDAGRTWCRHSGGPDGVLALMYLEDGVLLAGEERSGVWRSPDDGATWTASAAGLEASLLSTLVAVGDGSVWAAGLAEGVRVYADGRWREHNAGLAEPAVLGLTVATPDTVFAATPNGVYVCDGPARQWSPAWAGAVRAVAASDRVAVAVAETLIASGDLGRTWKSLDTPFKASDVISLVVAADAVVVAATHQTETAVWRSTPAGDQWECWFVDSVRRTTLPMAVSAEGVFVGLGRQVRGPRCARGVDLDATVTAMCIGAERAAWVGTTDGVFVSRDAGNTYQPTGSAGPRRTIAIAAVSGWVYALGLGGQLWRHPDSG